MGDLSTRDQEITFECRLCSGGHDHLLLDLGRLPLANDFVRSIEDGTDRDREPLALVMCADCKLLQLRELVPPTRLFRNYLWTSSSSESARVYAEGFSTRTASQYPPSAGYPFLVELASNDGLLLRRMAATGYRVLGVDPSNLADEATAGGVPTLRAFFGDEVAHQVVDEHGHADVVVARNVIGHVAELRGFLAGVRTLLRPGGVFIVESPYANGLRAELQYDTIFQEHVSYFTIATLTEALQRFGLAPSGLSFVPMNGGSFLCHAQRAKDPASNSCFDPVIELERVFALNEPEGWAWYSAAVQQQRSQLRMLLTSLADDGSRVVAYGAAAKTMTMFNYCGLTPELVQAIGDSSSRKQGLLCPGVHIPVVSPQELLSLDPDYVLIGAWNFTQEIVGQLRKSGYRGKFVVPLPVPRVLG